MLSCTVLKTKECPFSHSKTTRQTGQITVPYSRSLVIEENKDLPFNSTVLMDKGSEKIKSCVASFPSSHNPVEDANAFMTIQI